MSGIIPSGDLQSHFMAAILSAVKNPSCCETCKHLAAVADDFIKAGGKSIKSKKSKGA